jgi:hypothetical protein
MAYDKSSSGCTPITAKIKRTTQGGVVQPLLNMGAPVKMKASSPAKNMTARKKANEARIKARKESEALKASAEKAKELKKAKELSSKEFISNKRGRRVKNPKYQLPSIQRVDDPNPKTTYTAGGNKKGESMTPYSVKDGKGVIHGPKVSYDMAYKNRGSAYKDMSKADYAKEAKRQTKSFESTGKWDAPKPRKTQKAVSTISSKIKPQTKKAPQVSAKKVKQVKRISSRAEKTKQKRKEALAAGNVQKATRLKKRETRLKEREARKAKRAIRKASK